MKSFFKKLAFVMAMAMVVSLAAPAAANAASEVIIVEQTSTTAEPVYVIAEGAEMDFRFLGAPKNWKELGWKWSTADEAVATVDQTGLVKAEKAGTTELQFTLGGELVATAFIKVKGEADFEPVQLTEKQVAFVFPGDVKYTASDVALYFLIPLADGTDFPLPWDFQFDECKGNTVKISVFEQFTNGDRFRVVIGDEEKDFTAKIGAIDEVQITQSAEKVFANGEDGDGYEVTFGYKLLSQGVNLTNLYKEEADVRYELVSPTDEDALMEFVNFDDRGAISFWKEDITALVKAVYTYQDKDNNDKTLSSEAVKVVSEKVTPWSLETEVVDWCLVKTNEVAGKADWNKKSVPADESEEGEYTIVLKFKDSRGTEYVTHVAGQKDKIVLIDGGEKDLITANGYSFKFHSGNNDFMLVGSGDGSISVYKEGLGYFYVSRYKNDENGNPKLEAYVHASKVTVDAPRYLAKVEVTPDNVTVNADALAGYESLTTSKVTVKAFNQYNQDWHGAAAYAVTCSNEKINKLITAKNGLNGDWGVELKGNEVVIDGKALFEYSEGATSFTFTVTETASKKSDTFRVTVKKPNYDKNDNIVVDKIASSTYGTYNKVTVVANDINVAADKKVTDRFATITMYKTSNGNNVGQYEYIDKLATEDAIEDQVIIVNDKDWKVPAVVTAGTRYVVVKAPNGAIMTNVKWNADGNALTLQLAGDENGKMWYADKGTYTVQVITIRYSASGKQYNTTVTEKFEVTNTTEYKVDFVAKKADKSTAADIKQVVVDTLKFNLNNGEWKKLTAAMIDDVDYIARDGYVIIKSVTFHVPVDGETTTIGWNEAKNITVNVSVEAENIQ